MLPTFTYRRLGPSLADGLSFFVHSPDGGPLVEAVSGAVALSDSGVPYTGVRGVGRDFSAYKTAVVKHNGLLVGTGPITAAVVCDVGTLNDHMFICNLGNSTYLNRPLNFKIGTDGLVHTLREKDGSNYSAHKASNSALITNNTVNNRIAVAYPGGTASVPTYTVNGKQYAGINDGYAPAGSGDASWPSNRDIYVANAGSWYFIGRIYCLAIWDRYLDFSELEAWFADPLLPIRHLNRRIYAGGTTGAGATGTTTLAGNVVAFGSEASSGIKSASIAGRAAGIGAAAASAIKVGAVAGRASESSTSAAAKLAASVSTGIIVPRGISAYTASGIGTTNLAGVLAPAKGAVAASGIKPAVIAGRAAAMASTAASKIAAATAAGQVLARSVSAYLSASTGTTDVLGQGLLRGTSASSGVHDGTAAGTVAGRGTEATAHLGSTSQVGIILPHAQTAAGKLAGTLVDGQLVARGTAAFLPSTVAQTNVSGLAYALGTAESGRLSIGGGVVSSRRRASIVGDHRPADLNRSRRPRT